MQPMDAGCIISNRMECIIGGNMALYISNKHILYYHVDAYGLT